MYRDKILAALLSIAFLIGIALLIDIALPSMAAAQTVELKIHHPLPVSSTVHQKVLLPWCEALRS